MRKRGARLVVAVIAAALVAIGGVQISGGLQTADAASTGKIAITKKNATGSLLAGACFQINVDAGGGALGQYVQGSSKCDRYDEVPNDGHVNYSAFAPGNYVLWEYRSPTGYLAGKKVRFTVQAGQTTRLTVKDAAGGARLRITTVDSHTAAKLLNGCYTAFRDAGSGALGSPIAGGSDGYDGVDGVTTIGSVGPGDYVLVQGCVPSGYQKAANKRFHVDAGVPLLRIIVRNKM